MSSVASPHMLQWQKHLRRPALNHKYLREIQKKNTLFYRLAPVSPSTLFRIWNYRSSGIKETLGSSSPACCQGAHGHTFACLGIRICFCIWTQRKKGGKSLIIEKWGDVSCFSKISERRWDEVKYSGQAKSSGRTQISLNAHKFSYSYPNQNSSFKNSKLAKQAPPSRKSLSSPLPGCYS